ncbi:MAG: hypothetical protein V4510_12405, partial [bacterium]
MNTRCSYCILRALKREAIMMGAMGLCSTPAVDPRNKNWILTDHFIVPPGQEWDRSTQGPHWRIRTECPEPLVCVCDRPLTPGLQVYGNSRDSANWPHMCPRCGYHAAVVADDGVTVIKCRAYGCGWQPSLGPRLPYGMI